MSEKRIKYICYYDSLDPSRPRECVPAATTKIDYIVSVLNRIGYKVDIVSYASVSSPGFNLSWGGKKTMANNNTLRHFISLGCMKWKALRVFSRWLMSVHFICWFLSSVKHNEQIIIYHSLGYCTLFLCLLRVIKCSVVGEIEEIYQDVHPQKPSLSRNEYRFISQCDKYIFPTQLLDKKLNLSHKPSLTIHGLYCPAPNYGEHFNDDLIHVIYSGTFDPKKGGAMAAATTLLPANYHIHITGFGNEQMVESIRQVVAGTVKRGGNVTFEGMLDDDTFRHFLQKCHIGLCTQNPSAAFNATGFPSKILNYLANGLKVVTCDTPAIRISSVANVLTFYQEQTPEALAEAILRSANTPASDGRKLLSRLDAKFEKELKSLLHN